MIDEPRFWAMIEEAWKAAGSGGHAAARRRMADGNLDEEEAGELADVALEQVVPALQGALEQLSRDDLVEFDRILERKLFDIDRAAVQEYTDGSDDGFLYARGFIVAAGHVYYEAVNADPSRAVMDLECEDLCYLPVHVYADRFGGSLPDSEISRETGSNEAGWADGEDNEG
jgi:hypothetical protein